jgi:hypothetical protein
LRWDNETSPQKDATKIFRGKFWFEKLFNVINLRENLGAFMRIKSFPIRWVISLWLLILIDIACYFEETTNGWDIFSLFIKYSAIENTLGVLTLADSSLYDCSSVA